MGKKKIEKDTAETVCTTSKELTLAECIKKVIGFAGNNVDVYFGAEEPKEKEKPVEAYERMKKVLELINDNQVELFSVIIENSMCGQLTSSELADRLGASKVELLVWQNDLVYLASKRYILFNQKRPRHTSFIVPDVVVNAVAQNRKPNVEDLGGMSVPKFVNQLDSIYRCFYQGDIDLNTLLGELDVLYSNNKENELVTAYNEYNLDNDLDYYEKALLSYMLCRKACHGENCFEWSDYCKLFYDCELCSEIKATIDDGELILMQKGIVEFDNSEGFEHQEYIRLTNAALQKFLGDYDNNKHIRRLFNPAIRVITPEEITPKPLFFNPSERKELDRLTNMLQNDNYEMIIKRMEERGMRKGITALLYGAPGTGKTASVYNLCAATGRSIYFVDMSQIKGKFVGQSETNLKNVFRAYHRAVRENEIVPLMIWNEVDAIFSKRRNVTSAVDKMDNAMQNIILQELEDLEGILIATTNFSLKEGFDPAMERRFLLKIKFDKPQVDARTKIWQSMFTDISEADARTLATEFDMSGGLIENCYRKYTVDYILSGQQPNLDYLRELCIAERAGTEMSTTHIGF